MSFEFEDRRWSFLLDDFQAELFEEVRREVNGDDCDGEGDDVGDDCRVGHLTIFLRGVAIGTSQPHHGEQNFYRES
jgi:hypothetical protein